MNPPALARTISAFVLTAMLSAHVTAQSMNASVRPAALRDALVAFADDSLGGRLTGSKGAAQVALFIEQSLTRMRVRPAGDQGKFTQDVPVVRVQIDSGKTELTGDGLVFSYGSDYQPIPGFGDLSFARTSEGGSPMFGGRLGAPDAASPAITAGKIVVMLPPLRSNGQPDYQVWNRPDLLASYSLTKALLIVSLELMPASVRRALDQPYFEIKDQQRSRRAMPAVVAISKGAASLILGVGAEAAELNRASAAAAGAPRHGAAAVVARATLRQSTRERAPDAPMRNVVAMLEGSDPALKSEYVVLSARIDQADISEFEPDMASVWPIDHDSIANGVNAGSGAVALLELARRMSAQDVKPRRSIVFLWTVGQQHGRLGADWFAEHSAIPRARIVANLSVDLIGRRNPDDTSTTASGYLQIFGGRRASSQFGAWIDEVNTSRFNFSIDAVDGAGRRPSRNACTDDRWSFAKHGIPSVLMTTARDGEYDADSDAISAIDFDKLARVTEFVGALATDIANRPARPVADKPKPDPKAPCIQ